jgi:transcriptional regulator with XRE-family HTH domain
MDNDLAQRLGAEVRRARVALRLTQVDAAERVGVSVESFARIERGGTLPSVPTLRRLTAVLAVSADVLLGTADRQEHSTAATRVVDPPVGDASDAIRRRIMRKLREADRETLRFVSRLVGGLEAIRLARRPRQRDLAARRPRP